MASNRPLLFNPHQASTEELEATLVRNGSILEKIERDLTEDQRRRTPRHWQVVGPRGSGKSHLTELLLRHMKEHQGWSTVRLPEEHYQTAGVSELLEQILMRLTEKPSPYADLKDPLQVEERVLADLKRIRKNDRKPILVIAENLGLLLGHQLSGTRDQARLRQILSDDPPIVFIATATSHLFATTDHEAPFYDFFQTIVLEDLSRTEISELVLARAKWDNATELLSIWPQVDSQLDAIYHLSGGNPRLVVALYNVLREGVTNELHSQLLELLDEVTPYFQARLTDIAPQAARILATMAIADGPTTPAEIARRCRLSTNQVTAQIHKLQEQRLVVPGGRPDLRSRYYEIRDRLFRIWLQMREDRGTKGRLQFLVEFYQRWYGQRFDQLRQAAKRLTETLWENLESGDGARCSDCLRTLDYIGIAARYGAEYLVSSALADIMSVQGNESALRAKREKIQSLYEDPRFRQHRELLGFIITIIFDRLNERESSLKVLRELVKAGAETQPVLSRFLDHLIERGGYEEAFNQAKSLMAKGKNFPRVIESAAVAAVSLGKVDEGLDLARRILLTRCEKCRLRICSRLAEALGRVGKIEKVIPLFAEATGSSLADSEEALRALAKIAAGDGRDPRDFLLASTVWKKLSEAPEWFLQAGVCTLSHTDKAASLALEYMSAMASEASAKLPQPAVDHLIEIVAELQAGSEVDPDIRSIKDRALSMMESKVVPEQLAVAFRSEAPYMARTRPKLRLHLLELYQQLRKRGLLVEDISPYAEAASVIKATDKKGALNSLHPEVREAVGLLLSPNNESTAPPVYSNFGSSER
jgi:DNA-binding MarR family transcriptional regulator